MLYLWKKIKLKCSTGKKKPKHLRICTFSSFSIPKLTKLTTWTSISAAVKHEDNSIRLFMNFCHSLRTEGRCESTFFQVISKMIFLEPQKYNCNVLYTDLHSRRLENKMTRHAQSILHKYSKLHPSKVSKLQ